MIVLLPVALCLFAVPLAIDLILMVIAGVAVRRIHVPLAAGLFLCAAVSAVLTLASPITVVLFSGYTDWLNGAMLVGVVWLAWQGVTLGTAAWAIAQLSVAVLHTRGETFWNREPLAEGNG